MFSEDEEDVLQPLEVSSFYDELWDESHDPKLATVTTEGIFRRYYHPRPPRRALSA